MKEIELMLAQNQGNRLTQELILGMQAVIAHHFKNALKAHTEAEKEPDNPATPSAPIIE